MCTSSTGDAGQGAGDDTYSQEEWDEATRLCAELLVVQPPRPYQPVAPYQLATRWGSYTSGSTWFSRVVVVGLFPRPAPLTGQRTAPVGAGECPHTTTWPTCG